MIKFLWKTPFAGFFFSSLFFPLFSCLFPFAIFLTVRTVLIVIFVFPFIMKTLIFACCCLVFLGGCSVQKWIETIIDGDKKHSGVVSLWADEIKARISSSGDLDLSNLGLWEVPDICKLLDAVDLRGIVSLDLSDNQIQQVSGLDCLPSLKDLNLSNNQVDSLVWFPLMENLEKLNLAKNKLTNLSGIEVLKGIIELQLWENYLEDLVWLENLANLQKLWVELNKLKDFDASAYLDQLKIVNEKYNNLKEKVDKIRELIPSLSE